MHEQCFYVNASPTQTSKKLDSAIRRSCQQQHYSTSRWKYRCTSHLHLSPSGSSAMSSGEEMRYFSTRGGTDTLTFEEVKETSGTERHLLIIRRPF